MKRNVTALGYFSQLLLNFFNFLVASNRIGQDKKRLLLAGRLFENRSGLFFGLVDFSERGEDRGQFRSDREIIRNKLPRLQEVRIGLQQRSFFKPDQT